MSTVSSAETGEMFGVPDLSVVVAAVNGWHVLEPTLEALDAQPERACMEVIVVNALGDHARPRLEARVPRLVVVDSPRKPIPMLRHAGVSRARGKIVATGPHRCCRHTGVRGRPSAAQSKTARAGS
jgi:hypothetical protein